MTRKTQRQLVLEALECGEPQAVWQISAKVGICEKRLSVVIDRMAQEGVIERQPERVRMVRQTRQGPREWAYKVYSVPKAEAQEEQPTAPLSGVFGSLVSQIV